MRAVPLRLFGLLASAWLILAIGAGGAEPFVIRPYLQLGSGFADGNLSVVWHAARGAAPATLDWRQTAGDAWLPAATHHRVELSDRSVVEAVMPVGRTGRAFEYRVRVGAETTFTGRGLAPPSAGAPFGFAVLGDAGDGGSDQAALAARLLAERAADRIQLVILAGDLAYDCGRRAEYAKYFFPVYNAEPDAAGQSLMRDRVFVAAVGNHDVGDKGRWLARCSPDYSYFDFWKHPAGFPGPLAINGSYRPRAPAAGASVRGSDLPRVLARANFSFDWGGAHFVVLDSNRHVDWANRDLIAWLDRDLERAAAARWRFVVFHHPPFNLARTHDNQQWMRALAPVFERHGVSVVFSGHVHNFQWFGPVTFAPNAATLRRLETGSRGPLAGTASLQTDYDGDGRTRATAPVYLVSGAGGHGLKDQAMRCPGDLVPRPADCTARAVMDGTTASATMVSVERDALRIRQVAADGRVLLTRILTGR